VKNLGKGVRCKQGILSLPWIPTKTLAQGELELCPLLILVKMFITIIPQAYTYNKQNNSLSNLIQLY